MRPKKLVVLYCVQATVESELKFLLETRGYAVHLAAEDPEIEVLKMAPDIEPRMSAVVSIRVVGAEMAAESFCESWAVPVILWARTKVDASELYVLAKPTMVLSSVTSNADFLEHLRRYCARKRGPKKKEKHEDNGI